MANVTWGVQKTWTHAALLTLSRHYGGRAIAVAFDERENCVLLVGREQIGEGETLERACELALHLLTDAQLLAAAFPEHDTQPNNELPEQ